MADVGTVLLLKDPHGALFIVQVDARAIGELDEVHLVAVELGTIHAGELGLASHSDPARSAHAGGVHQDGVQAHLDVHAVDSVTLRQARIIVTGPIAITREMVSLPSRSITY